MTITQQRQFVIALMLLTLLGGIVALLNGCHLPKRAEPVPQRFTRARMLTTAPEPPGLISGLPDPGVPAVAPSFQDLTISKVESGLLLSWFGQSGFNYEIQSSPALSNAVWTTVTTIPGNDHQESLPVSKGSPQRYYRYAKIPVVSGSWFFASPQTPGSDSIESLSEDASGNCYVAGQRGNDLYVAKHGAGGGIVWSAAYTGLIFPHGTAVGGGRFFVVGEYQGNNIMLGGPPLPNAGLSSYSLFVVCYDAATGAHLWSHGYFAGSQNNNRGFAAACDATGNLILGGVAANINFGDGTVYTATGQGAAPFWVKYNGSTGARITSQQLGQSQGNVVAAVVDSSGRLLLAGYFFQSLTFNGGSLAAPNYAGFVAKLNSDGTHQWSSAFDSFFQTTYSHGARGIAVDSAGNIGLTGSFDGTMTLGCGNITAGGSISDAFLAVLSSSGNCLWSRSLNSPFGNGRGVTIDSNGNFKFSGDCYAPANFGGQSFPVAQGGFLATYNISGALQTLRGFSGNTFGNSVSANHVGGKWSGTGNFGNGPTNSTSGTLDGWTMKP